MSDSDSHGPSFSILKWILLALAIGTAIWLRPRHGNPLPAKEIPPLAEKPALAQGHLDLFDIGLHDKRLVVVTTHVENNAPSRQLETILLEADKKKTYGDRVAFKQTPPPPQPAGTEKQFAASFGGQLDFYSSGKKLGTLKGKTDPEVVHDNIRRYLEGLIKRVGADWLPEVEGMQPAGGSRR